MTSKWVTGWGWSTWQLGFCLEETSFDKFSWWLVRKSDLSRWSSISTEGELLQARNIWSNYSTALGPKIQRSHNDPQTIPSELETIHRVSNGHDIPPRKIWGVMKHKPWTIQDPEIKQPGWTHGKWSFFVFFLFRRSSEKKAHGFTQVFIPLWGVGAWRSNELG